MSHLLAIEVICYFGTLGLLIFWGVRGILTEQRFAIFMTAPLTLIIITAGLDANLSLPSPYPFGLVALGIGTLISSVLTYVMARWAYKGLFPPK